MNRTNYADQKGSTLQVGSKKQQRAQQVYQNINNLLENQEQLMIRMNAVGRVKVMKNQSGIHVLPLNEEDIRKTNEKFFKMQNASPDSLLLTQQGLTAE